MSSLEKTPEARIVDKSMIARVWERIAKEPASVAPVSCKFTKGMMSRSILMAAGSHHLSKIHRTQHQFTVMQGACLVSENGQPPIMMVAPYHGVTEPGTWRELFIIMDCVWITFHPTNKTTVEEVEAEIIEPMEAPSGEKAA